MNFLLRGALLYAILAMAGTEDHAAPSSARCVPSSPAASGRPAPAATSSCGLATGRIEDTEELQIALIRRFAGDGVIPLQVRRDGAVTAMSLQVTGDRRALTEPGELLPGLGFDLASWKAPTTVSAVPEGSAGAKAGLQAGDRLLAVDGEALGNSSEFVTAISSAPDRTVTIDLERAGKRMQINAAVPRVADGGRSIGRLGISVGDGPRTFPPGLIEMHRSGPIDALGVGIAKTWEMSALTVEMLWRMASGQVSAKNISGPISIAEFAGISAVLGLTAFMGYLAVISVSLGVLNLMPVPLLDGGQVVYQLVEAVKGSPLSERAQLFGQQIGIALLVVLMSLAFYNDISRHLN